MRRLRARARCPGRAVGDAAGDRLGASAGQLHGQPLQPDRRRAESVSVQFVVDMAEIPTFQALGGGDTRDGRAVSYAQGEAARWVHGLDLTVDGRRVPLALVPGSVHASLRPGQAGLSIMRAELTAAADIAGSGPYEVTYHERAFGDKVGWREIVVHHGDGVVLAGSTAATRDVSDMLVTTRPACCSRRSTSRRRRFGTATAPVRASRSRQAAVRGRRRGDVRIGLHLAGRPSRPDPGFVLLALLLAMGWGALHALSPGHGKSIVAAYLIGSRGTARHAAFLGGTVTVTHTAGVVALGLITLFLSQYIVPETLYPWLGLASGLIVVVMGASILARRIGRRSAGHHHHHHHEHDHGHGHHHHGDDDHGHDHGHSHLPPGADGSPITTRSMLALGVSGWDPALPIGAGRHARGDRPAPDGLRSGAGGRVQPRAGADADHDRRAGRLRRPADAAGARPRRPRHPLDPDVQRSGDYGARRRSDHQGARHLPRRGGRTGRRPRLAGGRPASPRSRCLPPRLWSSPAGPPTRFTTTERTHP